MIGRKKIQLRRIRESYRMRGKAARAIITNITRKEAVAAKEIGNINSKVNSLPENSVLNPDTSSLSPSTKSNGARFSSAKAESNHTRAIIRFIGSRKRHDL